MSDNSLLIAGTFAINLAILGGASLYLHSDYINRLDKLSNDMSSNGKNDSALDTRVSALKGSVDTHTSTLTTLQTTLTSNATSLSNALTTRAFNASNISASNVYSDSIRSSNLVIGLSASDANNITIQGAPSGSQKLMFGTSLSMSAVDATANAIQSDKIFNIAPLSGTPPNLTVKPDGGVVVRDRLCFGSDSGSTCITAANLGSFVKYGDSLTLGAGGNNLTLTGSNAAAAATGTTMKLTKV